MPSPPHSSTFPSAFAIEDQDIDIASAMGFASFGAKPNPPKKKRKIGDTDAISEGSGSNNTPLGIRGKTHGGLVSNLDTAQEATEQQAKGQLGGREEEGGRGRYGEWANGGADASGERGGLIGEPDFEDKGPAYIIGDEEIRTSDGNTNSVMAPQMHPGVSIAGMALGGLEPGQRTDGQWDWQALRRGVRDARGDMAFYDASFVEDPWKHLLNDKGDGGKGSGTKQRSQGPGYRTILRD